MTDPMHVTYGNDRIASRQIDELIGLARGLLADGCINQAEVEFLQKWLAATSGVWDQPLIATLYRRVNEILVDDHLDGDEARELFDTLRAFVSNDIELGEVLKATTLPLCQPAPSIEFAGSNFCFTGTFSYGQRKQCEAAVIERGGDAGSLTKSTDFLVIGTYSTDSWKHSNMGIKILKACDYRDRGVPIGIVSEAHWATFL